MWAADIGEGPPQSLTCMMESSSDGRLSEGQDQDDGGADDTAHEPGSGDLSPSIASKSPFFLPVILRESKHKYRTNGVYIDSL